MIWSYLWVLLVPGVLVLIAWLDQLWDGPPDQRPGTAYREQVDAWEAQFKGEGGA